MFLQIINIKVDNQKKYTLLYYRQAYLTPQRVRHWE